jgi:hypothetical protein
MISKEHFRLFFNLTKDQSWISTKHNEFENLLFSDCSSEEQQDLIFNLLKRFNYYDNDHFHDLLEKIAEEIVTDPDLNEESTQIVAMAADSTSDSSQSVLYALKPIFETHKWRKYRHVNNFGKCYQTYKKSNKHRMIVLIDEFIGTGQTALGRVKEIQRTFDEKKIDGYLIKIKCLIATQKGISNLKKEGVDVTSIEVLERGISDYYKTDEKDQKIQTMMNIEKILSSSYNGREMPSLGFGKSECLYARESGNTPNSVFPIFWWPFYQNGKDRQTLLVRAMEDA